MGYFESVYVEELPPKRMSMTEYLKKKLQENVHVRSNIKRDGMQSFIIDKLYEANKQGKLDLVDENDESMWMNIGACLKLVEDDFPLVKEIQHRKQGDPQYKQVSSAISNAATALSNQYSGLLPFRKINSENENSNRKYFLSHVFYAAHCAEIYLAKKAKETA